MGQRPPEISPEKCQTRGRPKKKPRKKGKVWEINIKKKYSSINPRKDGALPKLDITGLSLEIAGSPQTRLNSSCCGKTRLNTAGILRPLLEELAGFRRRNERDGRSGRRWRGRFFGEEERRSKTDGFVAAVAGGRRRGRERNEEEDGWREGFRVRLEEGVRCFYSKGGGACLIRWNKGGIW